MRDPEAFRHDRSTYERPTYKFRCGRAAEWKKPCWQGPGPDGTCGGTAECTPARIGDRFECRRPAIAGGPCADGPNSDGSCCRQHPPCRPRRTLRRVRGLISILAFTATAALIAMFLTLAPDSKARLVPLNPGPLTDSHAKFTSDQGCVACHEPHDAPASGWFAAAFVDSDVTGRCLSCHAFAGPERRAHNTVFADRPDLGAMACAACHREHEGEMADIAELTDAQCNSCHRVKMASFSKNHPPFSENFPHFRRTSVQFDHIRHLNIFAQAREAPKTCTACHAVEGAGAEVRPMGFEETCAACHGDKIARREMVVLRLPEFEENLLDLDDVIEVCGPLPEWFEPEDEYEPISFDEEMTPIGAYLLGVPPDEPEEYGKPMQDLIFEMAEYGASPLEERIEDRAQDGDAGPLLAGLNPDAAKRTACAWAANLEYELPDEPTFGGWYGDEFELIYRPSGHADPVIRSWIEFAIAAAASAEDEEDLKRAIAMRDSLLDRESGPGACVWCHAVTQEGDDEGALIVEWRYSKDALSPHTVYRHGPHIGLLSAEGADMMEAGKGCQTCHLFNKEALYADAFDGNDPHDFESNFLPITKEVCAECHAKGEVRQECQLCHVYHKGAASKLTGILK